MFLTQKLLRCQKLQPSERSADPHDVARLRFLEITVTGRLKAPVFGLLRV